MRGGNPVQVVGKGFSPAQVKAKAQVVVEGIMQPGAQWEGRLDVVKILGGKIVGIRNPQFGVMIKYRQPQKSINIQGTSEDPLREVDFPFYGQLKNLVIKKIPAVVTAGVFWGKGIGFMELAVVELGIDGMVTEKAVAGKKAGMRAGTPGLGIKDKKRGLVVGTPDIGQGMGGANIQPDIPSPVPEKLHVP